MSILDIVTSPKGKYAGQKMIIPRFELAAAGLNIATAESSYLKQSAETPDLPSLVVLYWCSDPFTRQLICYMAQVKWHDLVYDNRELYNLYFWPRVRDSNGNGGQVGLTRMIGLTGPNPNPLSSIWAGPIHSIMWRANGTCPSSEWAVEWMIHNIDITALII